ncbi:MAG: protein kinase, partial [Myxococcota bacterium]
ACTEVYPGGRPSMAEVLAELQGLATASAEAWFSRTAALSETRRQDLHPGARYTRLDELGRGGMGIVWRAWDEHLMRYVALKRPPPGAVDEARFAQEAQLAARLEHPNIVRVFDVDRDNEGLFYTMELVHGTTLRERLQRGPMHPHTAATLVRDLARAAEHAHQSGLVHRDIKPANIMIEETGRPRLVDFGLAKALSTDGSRLTRTGEMIGTPAYMAPEQIAGSEPTPAVDVYALGAILFQCLTGQAPHDSGSTTTLLHRRTSEPAELARSINPRVPADLEAICAAALTTNPSERTPSALFMADDLERYLTGQAVNAVRQGPIRRARTWIRRHPRAVAWAAVVPVAFAATLAATVGTGVYLEARAEAERASAASARWLQLDRELSALYKQNRTVEAEDAFRSFVEDPATQNTSARVRAWLSEADRLEAADELQGSVDATGRAWLESFDTPSLVRVAGPLQERLSAIGEYDGAARVARELVSLAPEHTLDPAVLHVRQRGMMLDRRLSQAGDLPADAATTRLARTLSQASMVSRSGGYFCPYDHDGDGRPEVLELPLSTRPAERPAYILNRSVAMSEMKAFDEPGYAYARPSGPALLRTGPEGSEIKPKANAPWLPLPDGYVAQAGAPDPQDPTRHYLIQAREPAALFSWSETDGLVNIYPPLSSHGGELDFVLADDFTGDGRTEVVVAPAQWSGFELNVLTPSIDGPHPYRVLHRERFGFIAGMATIDQGPNPPLFAVAKNRQYGSRNEFPTGSPYGAPTGLYLFSVDDTGAHQEVYAPSYDACATVVSADVDGDGWSEAYASCTGGVLVAATHANGVSTFHIAGISVHGAADLDQNGDDELIVKMLNEKSVWVVGMGEGQLPPIDPRESAPSIEGATPAARRALSLARAGLGAPAAERLASLARSTSTPEVRSSLFAYAAQVYTEAAMPLKAQTLMEEMGDTPEALADFYEQRGQLHSAAASLQREAPASAGPAPWSITFDKPELHPAFEVHSAYQARLAPDGGGLELQLGGSDPVATVHLKPGPRIRVAVDFTIEELDWSAVLSFDLGSAGEHSAASRWFLQGRGGARLTHTYMSCLQDGAPPAEARPFEDGPREIRVVLERDVNRARCSWLDLETGREHRGEWAPAPPFNGPSLSIRTTRPTDAVAGGRVRLKRIQVEGSGPGTAPLSPKSTVYRALTQRQPERALAALPPDAPPIMALIANADLGDATVATQLLRRAVRSGPSLQVAAALRTGRYGWLPTLQGAMGARWTEQWSQAYATTLFSKAPNADTDLLIRRDLSHLPETAGTSSNARTALAQLYIVRGNLSRRDGDMARAKRDISTARAMIRKEDPLFLVSALARAERALAEAGEPVEVQ